MAARAFDRISVLLDAKIYCRSRVYSGTVVNVSESGMFIKMDGSPILSGPQLDVVVSLNKDVLRLSGKIIRQEATDHRYGVGIEVLDPNPDYLDFIFSLMAFL
ncbi:MAG: PilZ domain-containing protein [Nitrospiraceae bacterium]|nr:MAG: PilZ domain-containing protein [Nitrospiraceae bacterium]